MADGFLLLGANFNQIIRRETHQYNHGLKNRRVSINLINHYAIKSLIQGLNINVSSLTEHPLDLFP